MRLSRDPLNRLWAGRHESGVKSHFRKERLPELSASTSDIYSAYPTKFNAWGLGDLGIARTGLESCVST
jgi:hypothetical protein